MSAPVDPTAPDAAPDLAGPPADAPAVTRRRPFSTNPVVGTRGHRTQQRILDAALAVFGEQGYDRCTVDQITERAGCSRASFYQYFSTKEDVYHQLTGQVARQLIAGTEALGPLTPDADGWASLRTWVARRAEVYHRYEPVFHAFHAASQQDEDVAVGGARWQTRNTAMFHSRIVTTTLPPRELDPVIAVLLEGVTRTFDVARLLHTAAPDAYPDERVGDALADVLHRSLFALDADVNVHRPAARRPPVVPFDPVVRAVFQARDPVEAAAAELTPAGRQTLLALLASGRDAFVRLGYHRTRIDDLVDAAQVSHGAFYRYFENKDELARMLTAQAMLTVSDVLTDIPAMGEDGTSPDRAALRRWLRRYNRTQSNEAAMLHVWVDASLQDPTLRASSAAAVDWGRRRMSQFLRPRGFGDVETEAAVLIAFLSAFGSRARPAASINAAAHIIEQGFLGSEP